eukprot:superscaffoldBa00003841_g17810
MQPERTEEKCTSCGQRQTRRERLQHLRVYVTVFSSSPPQSTSLPTPRTNPDLRRAGGEAIYSNHRDLARAPRSPRGLIGNQRDGGYEGERERNKLYLNFRSVEQTSPIPNPKQLCHEIVVSVGGRDEVYSGGHEQEARRPPMTV